jgi:hypothetical protein
MEDPTLDQALKHVGLLLFQEKAIRSTTSRSEFRGARSSGLYSLNCRRSLLTSYAITTVMGIFRERLAMQFNRPYRRVACGFDATIIDIGVKGSARLGRHCPVGLLSAGRAAGGRALGLPVGAARPELDPGQDGEGHQQPRGE